MIRLIGAGVLCWTKSARGHVLVLLGREREVLGWRQGSRKWGGFSGRAEEGETAARAAAREFVEETCACVPLTGLCHPVSVAHVERVLAESPCEQQTLLGPSLDVLGHMTYFCHVEHAPGLEAAFLQARTELLRLDAVFRAYQRVKKGLEHLPRLATPGFLVGLGFVTTDVTAGGAGEIRVEYRDQAGARDELVLGASPSACAEAVALCEAWMLVRDFVSAQGADPILLHPAVTLQWHGGVLVNAAVDKAYLEKTEVAWWELEELERLARDRWRGEGFRRYFLDSVRQHAPRLRCLAENLTKPAAAAGGPAPCS